MTDPLEELRGIGRAIKNAIGSDTGFALLLQAGPELNYLSNGHREDVFTTLEEWLSRTSQVESLSPLVIVDRDKGEPSEAKDERLALERKCADVGGTIAKTGSQMFLLLFTFGEKGNLAYFTNMQDARGVVRRFLDQQRSGIS